MAEHFRKWRALYLFNALFVAAVLWLVWPGPNQTIRDGLDAYQTLLSGVAALWGGLFAFFGLLTEVRSSDARHAADIEAADDERMNQQRARASAIAGQVSHSVKVITTAANYLIEIHQRGGDDNIDKREELSGRLIDEVLPRIEAGIARYDDTVHWAREALLEIRAKSQGSLTRQIDNMFIDVRNIEINRRRCQHTLMNNKWPDDKRVRELQRYAKDLEDCYNILRLIVKNHGRTNVKEISDAEDAQLVSRGMTGDGVDHASPIPTSLTS